MMNYSILAELFAFFNKIVTTISDHLVTIVQHLHTIECTDVFTWQLHNVDYIPNCQIVVMIASNTACLLLLPFTLHGYQCFTTGADNDRPMGDMLAWLKTKMPRRSFTASSVASQQG